MNKGRLFNQIVLICLCISVPGSLVCSENQPQPDLKVFNHMYFQNILSNNDRLYLGLSNDTSFTFREIAGDLLLVDLTNAYCFQCKKEVPLYNDLFKRIQNHSTLRGKVKIIGIAIGNTKSEIDIFKNVNKPLYPLLIDPHFSVHKAVGSPRVPHLLFVGSDKSGNRVIWGAHQGTVESAESIMNNIRKLVP